jgi:hypothetical protein
MTEQTVLEFVIAELGEWLDDTGASEVISSRAKVALEEQIREKFGGRWHYIPSEDKLVRNRRVVAIWNQALRENAVAGRPETVGQVRDRVCAKVGIKRRTLQNILAGRVAEQHIP